MRAQVQNPSFLNAQKLKIYPINYSSQSELGSKKKLSSLPSKRKYVKPVVSFLNFCKDKNIQTPKIQQNQGTKLQAAKKEEIFQFHEFQEHQSNLSQIGSQYGQKNYDHQLKQVLKKPQHPSRKQLDTQKVIFRAQTQQKQNFESITKYERFQKFRTQIHNKHNANLKGQLINYETYCLEGDGIKKVSRFYQQSQKTEKAQHRVKTQVNSKLEFVDKKSLQTVKKQQKQKIPQFNNPTSKPPIQIDSRITFQPIEFKIKNITPSHRRSRTQQEIVSCDKQKADQIFQKYHRLKKNYIKCSRSKESFFKQKINSAIPATIQLCEKQMIPLEPYKKKFSNDGKKLYRSLPKYEPMTISENVYSLNSPTSRAIMTPKSLSKGTIDEQIINKMVKERQKEFFEKNSPKAFELANFTFQQIKSKLSKLDLSDAKKHKKSSARLGNKKNVLLYSEMFIGGKQEKLKQEQFQEKQKLIKFKGIAFKANLIRKHTDVYEKQLKKIIQKKTSLKVTPKLSQVG